MRKRLATSLKKRVAVTSQTKVDVGNVCSNLGLWSVNDTIMAYVIVAKRTVQVTGHF